MLERELQGAETDGLDGLDIDLVFAARFVDAERAAHGDVQTIFGAEFDAALLLLEENATHLRTIVFQGEIDVAGLRGAAIGNFAFDPDVGEIAREQVTHFAGEFADGEDAALRHEVEGELAHWT